MIKAPDEAWAPTSGEATPIRRIPELRVSASPGRADGEGRRSKPTVGAPGGGLVGVADHVSSLGTSSPVEGATLVEQFGADPSHAAEPARSASVGCARASEERAGGSSSGQASLNTKSCFL